MLIEFDQKFSNISTKLVVSVCSNSELVLFISYEVVTFFQNIPSIKEVISIFLSAVTR